jgi:hypothetical protein
MEEWKKDQREISTLFICNSLRKVDEAAYQLNQTLGFQGRIAEIFSDCFFG